MYTFEFLHPKWKVELHKTRSPSRLIDRHGVLVEMLRPSVVRKIVSTYGLVAATWAIGRVGICGRSCRANAFRGSTEAIVVAAGFGVSQSKGTLMYARWTLIKNGNSGFPYSGIDGSHVAVTSPQRAEHPVSRRYFHLKAIYSLHWAK
jgi:hypothetical protein